MADERHRIRQLVIFPGVVLAIHRSLQRRRHVPTGGQSQVIFRPVDTSRHPEVRFIASDVVNVKIPSHHDPDKLARTIMRKVWQA